MLLTIPHLYSIIMQIQFRRCGINLLIQSNSLYIPLADKSINCVVTSPPYYGLRDYGVDGQIGLEQTPDDYVNKLVNVFREVKRVLRDDGTLWLNLGDSYASMKSRYSQKAQSLNGGKPQDNEFRGNKIDLYHHKDLGLKDKDLIGIPWRVAFALQADGWYLRSDCIWAKPNPMPESVKDRPTKAHEYIFLLSKKSKYYYDNDVIKEPLAHPKETRRPVGSKGAWELDGRKQRENGGGSSYSGYPNKRNKRDVWTVSTKPYRGAHYATFPPDLIEPCILAGCPEGGVVLDPFVGSGTTVMVANRNGRKGIGLDLSWKYLDENARIRTKEV